MSQGLIAIIAVLVSVLPIIYGLIACRRTNFIHGLIATFFASFVLVFAVDTFIVSPTVGSLGAAIRQMYEGSRIFHMSFVIKSLVASFPQLEQFTSKLWVFLAAYGVVYLISLVISSALAANKKRKIRDLKREAKRY